MKKVVFLTFAGQPEQEDGKYTEIQAAAVRLQEQATNSGVFCSAVVVGWDEIYEFASSNNIPMPDHPGKFLFKPFLAKMAISGFFGDAHSYFYADAGCEISNNRFAKMDYKKMITKSEKSGIYVEGTRYKDISWCTSELVERISPSENHLHSGQVQATFFLISNNISNLIRVRQLIDEWLSLGTAEDGKLIGDSYIPNNQNELFIAPRNDQSILSLLIKKYGFKIYREKRRGFGNLLFSLRGSNVFLFTSRNRTGMSMLPKSISSPIIGFITITIKPVLYFHDYISDSCTKRKQYCGFPRESISRQSRWP
ncbi:hypothetical protein MCEMRH37_00038 [Candidatus Nanopelagicaceae bacterium]